MALILGSVTVSPDGTVTKSGERGALYDLLVATFPPPTGEGSTASKDNIAKLATVLAEYTYTLLTARAKVVVGPANAALQLTPAPLAPSTPTLAPLVPVVLDIT